jgi:primase-polymerase (primpol)-like protein
VQRLSRGHAPTNGTAKAANLNDRALLDRARHAKNSERFCALYDRGDWKALGFPSQSEADLALCSMLAFWCGADKERVDQLFRTSSLIRPKWEDRTDYRERTLEAAIAACTETYESSWQNNSNGGGSAKAKDSGESEKCDAGGKPQGDSQAAQLVKLAQATGAHLFHDDEDSFATVHVGDHVETYALKSRAIRHWLT